MIDAVSSHTPVHSTPTTASTPAPTVAAAAPKEDSVQLSAAATKAATSGDVDHDGDSH